MWYKLATINMTKVNEYISIFQTESNPVAKYTELMEKVTPGSEDETALKEAFNAINNIPKNSSPNSSPTPNTTDKNLIPLNQLERRDPNEGPSDLIVRPPGGELDLYKPKEDDDPEKPEKDDDEKEKCIIEEEVFIQNLLTKLTGYAQIYFKKKIFTISQDTYGGNRSPLAPVQRALGLTPPGALGPNTQAYDPASSSWRAPSTRDFARPAGPLRDKNGRILKDPSGANMTVSAPVKDKTVVWNTADVQSIMSSLEKIAQMPELQKYGAKEITNILRYPLLQVKNEYEKIDEEKEKIDEEITSVEEKIKDIEEKIDELDDKIYELHQKMRENHYEYEQIKILLKDTSKPKTPTEILSLQAKQRKLLEDSRKLVPLEPKYKEVIFKYNQVISKYRENIVKLNSKKTKLDNIKPEVEVVPFKDFYKLTELSRYYIYKGSQLNEVFCKLEAQLIKTLNNTLNTLGKMEKNKRLKDIYENARGKK